MLRRGFREEVRDARGYVRALIYQFEGELDMGIRDAIGLSRELLDENELIRPLPRMVTSPGRSQGRGAARRHKLVQRRQWTRANRANRENPTFGGRTLS